MMPFTVGLDISSVKKNSITYIISQNYARIKVDSYNSLPLEKTLTFYNTIMLIKSVSR